MLEKYPGLSIGQRIRRERIALCMSQEELADIIEVSTSSINRWENDKTIPHLHYQKQLCSAFGKQVEEIFGSQTDQTEEKYQTQNFSQLQSVLHSHYMEFNF